MTTTNNEHFNAFRTALQLRRQVILTQIRDQLHQSDDPSVAALRTGNGESDEVQVDTAIEELAISHLTQEFEELREIDAALARIEACTYGNCVGCGEPVPMERLIAIPTAKHCLQCQQDAERQGGAPHRD